LEPTSGRVCSPADSVSHSFTANSDIDWSDLLRVVGDVHVVQLKVAEGALYLETIPVNGIATRTTRNKRHIMSSRGYSRDEITSHCTGCHDGDPHVPLHG
jgi:hypothetical protein